MIIYLPCLSSESPPFSPCEHIIALTVIATRGPNYIINRHLDLSVRSTKYMLSPQIIIAPPTPRPN